MGAVDDYVEASILLQKNRKIYNHDLQAAVTFPLRLRDWNHDFARCGDVTKVREKKQAVLLELSWGLLWDKRLRLILLFVTILQIKVYIDSVDCLST